MSRCVKTKVRAAVHRENMKFHLISKQLVFFVLSILSCETFQEKVWEKADAFINLNFNYININALFLISALYERFQKEKNNDLGSGGSRISRGGGAPTPDAITFPKCCMSKRKNLDP